MLVKKESKFFLYNFVLTRITDKTAKLLQVPKLFVNSNSKVIRQPVSLLVLSPRLQLQLQLIYDRQSVGQSVLVSGAHLGPVTNFSFSLKFLLDS
jgi:hypothetical protein